jgi:prevent-host-death family protein
MESIAVSKFKATCLALLDQVYKTGQPLLVTKRGKPIAQVMPPVPERPAHRNPIGAMAGKFEIVGDIVAPVGEEDWDVFK